MDLLSFSNYEKKVKVQYVRIMTKCHVKIVVIKILKNNFLV